MALKVLKRQCFKVLIDHYNILTVVLISGNQKKNWSLWPKKFSLLIFFAAFLITNVFSMKLRQSSAFYDFVDALLFRYDGVWNKMKLSKYISISKILWNFEYFWNSLYAFPFPIWIIAFDNVIIGRN